MQYRTASLGQGILVWGGLITISCLAGCQSGQPAYVLFSKDRDVIAFRDSEYPTVYVADSRGAYAVGEGNAMLSRDGRFLLLIKKANLTLFDVPFRLTYRTVLPCDLPEKDLEVFFQEGPRLFLAVKDTQDCVSWVPGEGWKPAQRPDGQYQTGLKEDYSTTIINYDGEMTNPLVLEPDLLNARRTVWIRPDGSKVELLRNNDIPLKVAALVVYSPIVLVPGINGFYFMGWYGVFEPLKHQFGDHKRADLDELARQVKAGVIHHPWYDPDALNKSYPCPEPPDKVPSASAPASLPASTHSAPSPTP